MYLFRVAVLLAMSICAGAQDRAVQRLPVAEQTAGARLPVIDVHFHAPLGPGPIDSFAPDFYRYLGAMDSLNVRMAVLNGVPDVLYDWEARAPKRLIPALLFPCENGIATNGGRPLRKRWRVPGYRLVARRSGSGARQGPR